MSGNDSDMRRLHLLLICLTEQRSLGLIDNHVFHAKKPNQVPSCIMIIIIIAFKGAIRDLFTISSLRREPSRTLKWPGRNRVQIMCNTLSAYHVQHVILCATWYEGTAQLLSLTELKPHLFEHYFIA